MKRRSILSKVSEKYLYTKSLLKRFVNVVNQPQQSYFPEAKQKSRAAIFRDNFLWVLRHKEINRFYYAYGLDRKDTNAGKEILSYPVFRQIRDSRNLRVKGLNFNYACLLRDKFIFGQFLSSIQFPTPKNIALVNSNDLTWLDNMQTVPLDQIASGSLGNVNGFCKKLTGIKGEGAFPLEVRAGSIFTGNTELSIQQLKEMLSGTYLWQERVRQHEDIGRLHAESLNTMRILTFNNNGSIKLFSAALRIGTRQRAVDNWGAGGIAVAIDINSGTLQKYGVYKPGYGGRVCVHPDSGITLLGYPIPYFKESIELACQLHRYFYGVHSIGWDIAVTPDGPVLIEGNEDWDGSFAMSLEGDFKSRFLKMFSS